MIQSVPPLTPKQTALQQLALRQLEAAAATLKRLQGITTEQADREAVDDSRDWLAKSDDCIRNWYGGSPETAFDD